MATRKTLRTVEVEIEVCDLCEAEAEHLARVALPYPDLRVVPGPVLDFSRTGAWSAKSMDLCPGCCERIHRALAESVVDIGLYPYAGWHIERKGGKE